MDYATCPVCHTDRPIKKDGMLMKHRDTYNFVYRQLTGFPICEGSGQKPVERTEVVKKRGRRMAASGL